MADDALNNSSVPQGDATFTDLVLRFLDNLIDHDEAAELSAMLEADPQRRAQFVAIAVQSRKVAETLVLRSIASDPAQDDESESFDILMEVLDLEEKAARRRAAQRRLEQAQQRQDETERMQLLHRMQTPPEPIVPYRHIVIPRGVIYAACGAVAALIALAVFTWLPDIPAPSPTPRIVDTTPTPVRTPLAKLTRAEEARWSDTTLPTHIGAMLHDEPMELTHGLVELTFPSGTQVMLHAPARFTLLSTAELALASGQLLGQVPPAGRGFAVNVPGGRVVDHGTVFCVDVQKELGTHVGVFVGSVDAIVLDDAGSDRVRRRIGDGEAVQIDPQREVLSTTRIAPRQFAWALPYLGMLDRNLITNGDFEHDAPGVYDIAGNVISSNPITGWSGDHSTTVRYGTDGGFPKPGNLLPPARGELFYMGVQPGVLRQEIDVTPVADLIDRGSVHYHFSGWLGGYIHQNDHLIVSAMFFDAVGRELGTVTLPPVLAADRSNKTGFLERSAYGPMPWGTRRVAIIMESIVVAGLGDGFADNLAFQLRLEATEGDSEPDDAQPNVVPADASQPMHQ